MQEFDMVIKNINTGDTVATFTGQADSSKDAANKACENVGIQFEEGIKHTASWYQG